MAPLPYVDRGINLDGERVRAVRATRCVYCGSDEELCRDHVIPTSYKRQKRRYEGDWLVTACKSCNGTLGDKLIFNVPDRASYIRQQFRAKHKKQLAAPVWDEDELDDLGPALAKMIRNQQAFREHLGKRLEHLRLVSQMPVRYLCETRPHVPDEDEEADEFKQPKP
jgi:hypothetical protein